jgi:NAD(P)H-hydrate repair Nnr-like enzyme with NAD(P)H-hydrate dehydratase domain
MYGMESFTDMFRNKEKRQHGEVWRVCCVRRSPERHKRQSRQVLMSDGKHGPIGAEAVVALPAGRSAVLDSRLAAAPPTARVAAGLMPPDAQTLSVGQGYARSLAHSVPLVVTMDAFLGQ